MTEGTKCRCQSGNHGHKPGNCEQAATENDGYCKSCHDRAAKESLDAQNLDGPSGGGKSG
jgi:hypothetical protein